MRSGEWSPRRTPALRTDESACSSSRGAETGCGFYPNAWPTATACDAKASGSAGYGTESGRSEGTTLTDAAVRLWPTPAASVPNDHETPETWRARQAREKERGINGNGAGVPLSIAAKETIAWQTPTASRGTEKGGERAGALKLGGQAEAWPTPTLAMLAGYTKDEEKRAAPTSGGNTRGHQGNELLRRAEQAWATPCARDGKGAMFDSGHRHGPGLPDQATALAGPRSSEPARTLNPLFVEWLMGFPIGWSACAA